MRISSVDVIDHSTGPAVGWSTAATERTASAIGCAPADACLSSASGGIVISGGNVDAGRFAQLLAA